MHPRAAADPLTRTIPTSTYRLQLRREFGFRDAATVVDYIADLGVTHIYCSPILQAVRGSAHGYDVVSHRRLGDELGGIEGWQVLVDACHRHGLGLVVDVVPNHMAVPVPEQLNEALWDVLGKGSASAFAHWFDVDWQMGDGRLLMPVLGADIADAVRAGEITVDRDARVVRYFDHEFPIAAGTESLVDDVAELLDAQHYRLAHWRTASTELNYRRFFDVTSLIGVRVELDDVWDATHAVLLDRMAAGDIDGLRIDHPDGLADPRGYLDRLAQRSDSAWTVVEKILEPGERLPASWRADGTTGYDAIGEITQVLLDPAGADPLTSLYARATGAPASYAEVVEAAKREVVSTLFGSEARRLLREQGAVSARSTFGDAMLGDAVRELLVAFDVYRAYADDPPSQGRIDHAVTVATDRRPDLREPLEWVASALRGDVTGAEAFATRFAQTTGPVMAKGVEDTAFYRYLRLVALNEVGGDPDRFGATVEQWHEHCAVMAERWPASLTTLTTHDTKRSEDVRARLLVLAERPDEWAAAVEHWRKLAGGHGEIDGNTDYLFWQTLVGAWPLSAQRMTDYLLKAAREAKQHTSWLDPDNGYEQRLIGRAAKVMADDRIMEAIAAWVAETADATRSNVLAQKLLQLTMPGLADVYQGQEVDDRSLVDPDNRRAVDYTDRRTRLAALTASSFAQDEKLWVTTTTLRTRRDRPDSFLAGGYRPLAVEGSSAEHAIAYIRGDDVVAIATRLPAGLARRGGWRDTRVALPDGGWRDAYTGQPATPRLAELLAELPVALLVRGDG